MTVVRRDREQDESSVLDFEALYDAHAARLRRVITRRVRDAHLAEDIVQETFLRAHRFVDRLDHERSPWPWLRTIAMRLASNATRHQRFDKEDLVAEPIELPDVDGAAQQGEQRLLQTRLVQVLASLPDRHRRLLVLHDMFGVGCDEIAEAEGSTAPALRMAASRARRALRDHAHVARLGALTPIAAYRRAIRHARARTYAWWVRQGGLRPGRMLPAGGEALAPMAFMVCALVPSMVLPSAHAEVDAPRRAAAGDVHVASMAPMVSTLPPLPMEDSNASAAPRTARAKAADTVSDDGDARGVGPGHVGTEAPIISEPDAGERTAGDEPRVEGPPKEPTASTTPSIVPTEDLPPPPAAPGPAGAGAGNTVPGDGDVAEEPGQEEPALTTPIADIEIESPAATDSAERAVNPDEVAVDVVPGVR